MEELRLSRQCHQDPQRWFQPEPQKALSLLPYRGHAGLREEKSVEGSIGGDERLTLEPVQRLQRAALAEECRLLQNTMLPTPSVIEACRAEERW